jgi:predicted nucleic acid-binding protein
VSIFVDTNVLVYARDAGEPDKQPQAARWLEYIWRSQRGRLSTQVLGEYYVTVTRKLRPGLSVEEARRELRSLMAWDPLPVSAAVIELAWSLQDRFSLSYWDAQILGAAQIAGCSLLLTEDLQDGQVFDGLTVVNPFRHEPGNDLLA